MIRFRAWDVKFKEMVRVDALILDERVIKATYKNGNVVKEDIKCYKLMQSTGSKIRTTKKFLKGM